MMKPWTWLFALVASPVWAAPGDITTGLGQWLLSCFLVIGFILLLAWFMKKSRLIQPMAQGQLRVLSSLPLGTRERLLVVKVGEQQLLLGVTPGNIRFLCQLEQPLDEQQLPQPFAAQLGKLMNRQARPSGAAASEGKHET